MPAFFLISGMFSKKTVKERKIVKVVPYLLVYLFMKMFGLSLIHISYEKRFVVAVLQECHKMVVCRYVGDFLFVPSSV